MEHSSDSVTAIVLSTPIPNRKVTRELAEGEPEIRRPEARPA
jgi:hypothetical protein